MTRIALLVLILCTFSFAACKKKQTVVVCTPIDAGVATDAGDAGDAGSPQDAGDASVVGDAGTVDDGGPVDDAGPLDDAGVVSDAGVETDAGLAGDAGDAGVICQETEIPDAGLCRDVPCDTTSDCCDGTTCIQNPPPTCENCDLPAVSDCLTSTPCGSPTQKTCVTIGLDGGPCHCPLGPKSVCVPTCQTNGCPAGQMCNVATQFCDPLPCSRGFVCPQWTTCNQNGSGPNHGCEPKPCVDAADCFGVTCSNGFCGEFTGTCQY